MGLENERFFCSDTLYCWSDSNGRKTQQSLFDVIHDNLPVGRFHQVGRVYYAVLSALTSVFVLPPRRICPTANESASSLFSFSSTPSPLPSAYHPCSWMRGRRNSVSEKNQNDTDVLYGKQRTRSHQGFYNIVVYYKINAATVFTTIFTLLLFTFNVITYIVFKLSILIAFLCSLFTVYKYIAPLFKTMILYKLWLFNGVIKKWHL